MDKTTNVVSQMDDTLGLQKAVVFCFITGTSFAVVMGIASRILMAVLF